MKRKDYQIKNRRSNLKKLQKDVISVVLNIEENVNKEPRLIKNENKKRKTSDIANEELLPKKNKKAESHIFNSLNTNSKPFDINEFQRIIMQCPRHVCVCCNRLCFDEGCVDAVIDCNFLELSLQQKILGKDKLKANSKNLKKLVYCLTCANHLRKKTVPKNALINNMDPGNIPIELSRLTDIEVALISQIKPFFKIITLKGI